MKIKNAKSWEAKQTEGLRSLPCLDRNNSIGTVCDGQAERVSPVSWGKEAPKIEEQQKHLNEFTTAHRKSAYALQVNVEAFINKFGLNHVGFLTLTFADNVQCPKEAQRRFNSLRPLQNTPKSSTFPTPSPRNAEDLLHEQLFTHRRPPPHRKTSRPLPAYQTRPYS